MNIGTAISVEITKAGVKKIDLANAMGVSNVTISKLCAGDLCSLPLLIRAAKALGISPSSLLSRAGELTSRKLETPGKLKINSKVALN